MTNNALTNLILPPASGFADMWMKTGTRVGLRYLLFAGMAWLLAYVMFKKRWWPRKILQKWPEGSDIRRELSYSLSTMVIFGLVGAATLTAARNGWTRFYWSLGEHSGWWFLASLAMAIAMHDTYFYWTHRAMHHPRLFAFIHRVHHLSHNPSPWASYAFSPAEAVAQALIFPLIVFVLPIHPLAFGLFMLWQITINVIGHTGFEYHPRGLMDSKWGRMLNTPTNHAMHHEKLRGNYGLYFNVWDRLMGTNHEDYERRFREVTSRTEAH